MIVSLLSSSLLSSSYHTQVQEFIAVGVYSRSHQHDLDTSTTIIAELYTNL